MRENEAERFRFQLTLSPPGKVKVSESDIRMVEVNGAYEHGRYYENWLKSLRVTSNVKVSATQDGRPDGWMEEHDS